jgi:hypothetical protein
VAPAVVVEPVTVGVGAEAFFVCFPPHAVATSALAKTISKSGARVRTMESVPPLVVPKT